MKLGLLLILFSKAVSAASGEHHEAHISELIWPAFNFTLFFGFLIYKLRKPIKESFDKNSELIKELFEYAQAKDKDADKKMAEYKEKMNNFPKEVKKLDGEMAEELKRFEKEAKEETNRQIERASEDAKRKAEGERNHKIREINEALLNNVILKTKESLGSNSSLRDKAANKIIAAL